MTLVRTALLILIALGCSVAQAVAPGEYTTAGGWGNLRVTAGKGADQRFVLRSEGANGHSCELEGNIHGQRAEVRPSPGELACEVVFAETAHGVEVTSNGLTCRQFCGMRASFEGEYLRQAAVCTRPNLNQARRTALALYKAGKYQQSAELLQPVVDACEEALDWLEFYKIRNDLAIALHRAGDRAGCLKALTPPARYEDPAELTLLSETEPSVYETWLPVLKATRFNRALCETAAR